LQLACEEFEREWTPELHIKLERVSGKEATSASPPCQIPVLLQMMQIDLCVH